MKKEDLKKISGKLDEIAGSMDNARLLIDQSADKMLEECVVEIPVCGDHEMWDHKE